MTAFDNIKTNNWPATSNEFEDYLVLELPLNDAASLTQSRRDIVAGSTVLYPKTTLTNTGVSQVQPQSVANVKLHTYIYNTPSTFKVNGNTVPRGSDPNGDVTFTVAVNGGLSSIAWSYDSGNGPYCYMKGIEVDLGDGNGYQLIQDGAFGVSAYSSLISGTVDSSYPLSNLFGGTIGSGYTNGTRHTNPGTLTLNLSSVFPAKKHYDNNANFNNSSGYLRPPDSSNFAFGTDDFTVECWILTKAHKNYIAYLDTRETGQTDAAGWTLASNASGALYVYSAGFLVNSTISLNQWTHVAYCRASGTHALYVNGSLAESSTTARDYTDDKITIGANSYGGSEVHNGFLQDVRIYKGVAKYTANFTPPGAILS